MFAEDTPMSSKEAVVAPVRRDTVGLRDALFDELDALRQGQSNSGRANATAKICQTVIESVRMELEVRKFMQISPKNSGEPQPSLGSPIDLGA
jgi:hypothetical protein